MLPCWSRPERRVIALVFPVIIGAGSMENDPDQNSLDCTTRNYGEGLEASASGMGSRSMIQESNQSIPKWSARDALVLSPSLNPHAAPVRPQDQLRQAGDVLTNAKTASDLRC